MDFFLILRGSYMHLPPFNISILDPDEYIPRKNLLPVSSHALFETSSKQFHPEGLFSEAIFGQIGSNERLVRRAYLDLKTKIITPHLFKQLMTLKSYYQDIVSGKIYAYYDPELHDLVKTTQDDDRADTGYAFFIKHLPELEFPETSSVKRHDKIMLIKKFSDRITMDKLIVLPAGVRDVKEQNGRIAPEEINKLYLAILSLTQALPDGETENPIYDAIRYQLQMKVQEVYEYILNILTGKGGYMQGKFTHRHIVYSNRNVITAPILSRVASPNSPNHFGAEDIAVPLFQGMKAATPLVSYKLRTVFFDQVFTNQTNSVPLIDPKTLHLNYYDLETSEIRKYITGDGINDLINGFRDVDKQKLPVTVTTKDKERKYLYLVYDTGTDIYTFRDINDFTQAYEARDSYKWENLEYRESLDGWDPKDYVLFGSGALRVFGMDKVNQDIDLIVSPSRFAEIQRSAHWHRQPNGVYRNKDNRIDVYNAVLAKDYPVDEWANFLTNSTISVDGHHVFAPFLLREQYRAISRMKDNDKVEFLNSIVVDRDKIRPLTWVELFYMATYSATKDRHATSTRYPVLLIENIQVYKIHLMSTQPSRIVRLHTLQKNDPGILLPEYPDLDAIVKTSMSVGPWTLAKYDGKQWSPSRGEIPLAA